MDSGLTVLATDAVPVVAGATSVVLSNTLADLDGDFAFTASDVISATFTAGGAPINLPLSGAGTGSPPSVSFAPLPTGGTVTLTYRAYSGDLVVSATFTMASPLTYFEARATFGEGNWSGKIPRDSGIALPTPSANGFYDSSDLRVVVDGKTLSSADYTYNLFGPEAHLLRITSVTAQNTPNASAANVVVSYKFTEFDGTLFGGSIATPFGTVTASAGPTFFLQQAIPVLAATSLVGFADPPGTVRLATLNLNAVVKITFQYDAVDAVAEVVTVSTPTAVAVGRARSPTGVETAPTSNNFIFKAALMSLDDINTIEATIALNPNLSIAGLVAAVPATGGLNFRVNNIATSAFNGLGLASTSSASAFAELLVPIRDGETLTVTYVDADAGAGAAATLTKVATIDLGPPTITLDQPTDNGFAGAVGTIQATISDAGAGLKLIDVVGNLRTNPQVIGNVVASSALASAPQYSLSQTPISLAPIPEGRTLVWVGNTLANGVIRDAVGNEPRGSGAPQLSDPAATRGTSANPFEFTVDKAAPTLSGARTGGKLDTDPTSATVDEIIPDSTARNAITVELDLGIAGAPVDEASVSPTDFQVTADGLALPLAGVIVGKVPTIAPTTQKLLLVLGNELPTGALPEIRLAGTISDKASNDQTNVTIPANNVFDGLAPLVTVTISGDAHSRPISRDQVVIVVDASEPGVISGTARYVTASGDNTLGEDGAPGTIACGRIICGRALAFTSTGTNMWEAIVSINSITSVAEASGMVNVRILVTDAAGNAGTAGLADPDGTSLPGGRIESNALLFEFDNRLNDGVSVPALIFVLNPGPTITINFDAEGNEYAVRSGDITINVDDHPRVDLTKAILTLPDGSTGDVLANFQRTDLNSYVLKDISLPTGDYTLTVKAEDMLGNNCTCFPIVPGGSTLPTDFVFPFVVTPELQLNTVQGRVLLQGRDTSLGAFVVVGDAVKFVEPGGNFNIDLILGTHDVALMAPGYLSVTFTGVEVGAATVVLPPVTLAYGDANGDGAIDVRDLSTQAANLGKTSTTIPVP